MPVFKDITYDLRRSKRKTASIYIERDGQVTVLVPEHLNDQEVEALIEKRRAWIYRSLAEWEDVNATRVHREFVGGEGFLYLGRSYRLKLVEGQNEHLILKQGYFCLRADNGNPDQPDAAFQEFYRNKGLTRIAERITLYETRMGLSAKGLRVMDLKGHWASCSKDGTLNFHWKCMMAPLKVLDYVVAHELAHLKYAQHSTAFWSEVDKVIPDYQDRKRWLRENGAGMDL